ncbi:hypothetical protein DFQ27_009863 [Actinomortierella ambigua]|uniref:Nop52-domain-containing protein n=1 Tax=Actinomortierella ambigua TaxID=1343610 RepID=A0A9P6QG00_9FUNG|nr:hypothetical protein DFQ27_009863 [Actinomortierella ambigua]
MPAAKESSSPFGKRLASSDKKIRDKAVKALKTWISHKKSFTDLEVMKLWKGLFFCVWMSDKPVIQQQLSDTLSSLILRVPREAVMHFISAFWETIAAEWNNIDRLRMDKYYFLLRRFIYYSFKMLKENNWDLATIEEYTTLMINGPLNASNKTVPDSIRYHIIEIYLEELERNVKPEESGEVPSAQLLEPMFHLLGHTINNMVFRKVAEEVFEAILRKTAEADDDGEDGDEDLTVFDKGEEEDDEAESKDVEMAEDSDEDEAAPQEGDDEAQEVQGSATVFDYDLIGIKKRLFAVGANKETVDQNRRKVYTLYQAYQDFCPLDGDEDEKDEEDEEAEDEEAEDEDEAPEDEEEEDDE